MKVRRIKMTHKFTQTLRVFIQLNRKLHELVCLCECIYNSVCVCVRSDSMTVECVCVAACTRTGTGVCDVFKVP